MNTSNIETFTFNKTLYENGFELELTSVTAVCVYKVPLKPLIKMFNNYIFKIFIE